MALLLIALMGGSTLLVMSSLFGGTRKLDQDQLAAVQLESLCEVMRLRAEETWPNDISTSDTIGEFSYQVVDLGVMADPLGSPLPLASKRIEVTFNYTLRTQSGEVDRSEEVTIFVGQ